MTLECLPVVQTSLLNSRLTHSAAYLASLLGFPGGSSESSHIDPILLIQSLPPAIFIISFNDRSVLQLVRPCTWELSLTLSNTPHPSLAANPVGSYLQSRSGIRPLLTTTSANSLVHLSPDLPQWSQTVLPDSYLAPIACFQQSGPFTNMGQIMSLLSSKLLKGFLSRSA